MEVWHFVNFINSLHILFLKQFYIPYYEEDITINDNKNKSNQPSDSMDIYIAKLAFIGATIATLGDGLAALAAGLALQQLENPNGQNSQSQYDQLYFAIEI